MRLSGKGVTQISTSSRWSPHGSTLTYLARNATAVQLVVVRRERARPKFPLFC